MFDTNFFWRQNIIAIESTVASNYMGGWQYVMGYLSTP